MSEEKTFDFSTVMNGASDSQKELLETRGISDLDGLLGGLEQAVAVPEGDKLFSGVLSVANEDQKALIEKAGHKSVESVLSDLVTATAMTGADKSTFLGIPKASREEDADAWAAFDSEVGKLIGKPEKVEDYGAFEGADKIGLTEADIGVADATLFELGLTKAQRDGVISLYGQVEARAIEALDEVQAAEKKEVAKEMGGEAAFNKVSAAVSDFIEANASERLQRKLELARFADDPDMVAFLAKTMAGGAESGGSDLPGGRAGGGKMTAEAAQVEVEKIEKDPDFQDATSSRYPGLQKRRADLLEIVAAKNT